MIVLLSFSVFLIIFLGIGHVAASRLENSDADYLLGNRSFGRFFVGLSAGATGNSGFIMVGAVGMAYALGLKALLLPFCLFFGEWTFWTFFSDKVNRVSRERNAMTVPEMLAGSLPDTNGRKLITTLVAIISIVLVGAYAAAQFAAAGKTLNVFFGLSPEMGAIVAAVAILSYCVTGGLRSSIWTDVVQAVVVSIVAIGMFAIALYTAGGPVTAFQNLAAIDPKLTDFTAGLFGWGLTAYVVGFVALGLGFQLSQPQVLVRLLAGRSPSEVKTAKWIYLGYVYTTWSCMVLFGILCRILLPEIADPEQALPIFAEQTLSPFLVGIVLAGVFSVIASTADSQILVCSSALSRDVSPALYKRLSSKFGVRYQQMATLVFGALAVLATIVLSSSVFTLVLFAVGVLAASIGPAMIITLLKVRTNYIAMGLTLIVGLGTAISWRLLAYNEILNEALPAMVLALMVHALVMFIAFPRSLVGPRKVAAGL